MTRIVTIAGLTARYEEHEFRTCQELVAADDAHSAALIHQIKAAFDATLERDPREYEPEPEQLRMAA